MVGRHPRLYKHLPDIRVRIYIPDRLILQTHMSMR